MAPGDIPVAGAKITLYKDNAVVARVGTNDQGAYEFSNVAYGNYLIQFSLPLTDTLRYQIAVNQVQVSQNFVILLHKKFVKFASSVIWSKGKMFPLPLLKLILKK